MKTILILLAIIVAWGCGYLTGNEKLLKKICKSLIKWFKHKKPASSAKKRKD